MKDDQFQQLQIEEFLGGTDVNDRWLFLRYLLSYISPSPAHCKGSNSLNILGGLTDQVWFQFPGFSYSCDTIFSVFSCYEHHVVSLLKHSYCRFMCLCMFLVFVCRCCILFKEINTKSFKFLSFIMILISCFCFLQSSVVWEQRA